MVTTVGDSSRASRGPEDDDPDGPDDELPAPGRGLFLNLLRKSFSACPSAPRSHCSVVRKADPAMIIRPEFFRKSRREAPMGSSEGVDEPCCWCWCCCPRCVGLEVKRRLEVEVRIWGWGSEI